MKRRDVVRIGVGAAAAQLAAPFILRLPARAADLELIKPGEFSAATEGTYPPFSMQDASSNLDGIEMRMMRELTKRLGLTYKPVVIKWESILVGLLSNEYDMVSDTVAITPERQQRVTFCDGWLETGARLIVGKDSPIKTNADAKGKRIGLLVASIYVKMGQDLGGEVKTYKSDPDAIQDLANGNIDAVITDTLVAAYIIKKNKLPLRMTEEFLNRNQDGWPVKKGKPNLVTAVNKTLADMVQDGTYAKIIEPFLGYDPHPANPVRSILS